MCLINCFVLISNSLDPDKAWIECRAKLFAKGYQQITMLCKCLTKNISVQLQLVIIFKVSNSLDPGKDRTE